MKTKTSQKRQLTWMGSANSIKQISLHSDRGGDDTAHWTFKWGTILKGIEVMKEFGNALSAHLVYVQ